MKRLEIINNCEKMHHQERTYTYTTKNGVSYDVCENCVKILRNN